MQPKDIINFILVSINCMETLTLPSVYPEVSILKNLTQPTYHYLIFFLSVRMSKHVNIKAKSGTAASEEVPLQKTTLSDYLSKACLPGRKVRYGEGKETTLFSRV